MDILERRQEGLFTLSECEIKSDLTNEWGFSDFGSQMADEEMKETLIFSILKYEKKVLFSLL